MTPFLVSVLPEIAGCEAGCQRSLEACARVDADLRPKILMLSQAQCPAIDKKFLDAVAPFVSKYDRPAWLEHRKKAKL